MFEVGKPITFNTKLANLATWRMKKKSFLHSRQLNPANNFIWISYNWTAEWRNKFKRDQLLFRKNFNMYLQKESLKKIKLNVFLKIYRPFFLLTAVIFLAFISLFFAWNEYYFQLACQLNIIGWRAALVLRGQVWIPTSPNFFRLSFRNGKSCVFNCDDLLCIYFNLNSDKNAKSLVKLQKMRGSLGRWGNLLWWGNKPTCP